MLVKSPFLWCCHCSLPITFLCPSPAPSLAWRETRRKLWVTDYQEDDTVEPKSSTSMTGHQSSWVSQKHVVNFLINTICIFFPSFGLMEKKSSTVRKKEKKKRKHRGKGEKITIKTKIESEGWSVRRREGKGGGNDPCIERLGSPTGMLARMVRCLQTCWGLKLTLRLRKKRETGRQATRTWALWS